MATAGYSGTPLAKKLGIQPEHVVELRNAPKGYRATLGELPPDVKLVEGNAPKSRANSAKPANQPPNLIQFFTTSRAELASSLAALAKSIYPDRALWISWPKKSSGVASDVTEDVIRELALPLGLVDVKVCAVDETWSGLKLVWRKERR